jgi:hypothetical protein
VLACVATLMSQVSAKRGKRTGLDKDLHVGSGCVSCWYV